MKTYSPQRDGRIERTVQTVKRALASTKAGDHWEEQPQGTEGAYRYRKMADRYSPFWLMYGRKGRGLLAKAPTDTEAATEDDNLTKADAESEQKVTLLGTEGHFPDRVADNRAVSSSIDVRDVVLTQVLRYKLSSSFRVK